MHRPILAALAAFSLALTLVACAAEQSSSQPSAANSEAAARPAPPDSPMAKIKVGMSAQEVMNILGAPQAQNAYATGKAWIPFYYGDDVRRTAFYYKGLGRVMISGGNVFGGGGGEVVAVEYDPSEPGVAR
jgi:outer membrane protein assembly factor BamE (lipoprotein component of BamABCDE complex)